MESDEREAWIDYLLGMNAHSRSRSAWELKQPPRYAPLTPEARVRRASAGVEAERAAERQQLDSLSDAEIELRGLKALVSEQKVALLDTRREVEHLRRQCSELENAKERAVHLESALATAQAATSHRWPWGAYETALLRQLAATVEKFWVRYDPEDTTTASKSNDVVAWLTAQEVNGKPIANRVAEVMAQMTRADGLPTGPR